MSSSTDPDHFFQTSHSLAETQRKALKSKNKHGNPLQISSKILAVIADPSCPDGAIFVAEGAGNTREKDVIYKGPGAPVTSIAISSDHSKLLAGCWDKTIWSWSLSSRQPSLRYRGHTDFVKCVIALRIVKTDVIVSGGADACIIVWNIGTGQKLHVLKGHARGILDLAIDPTTYDAYRLALGSVEDVVIFSAGSDREIRRWRINMTEAEQLDAEAPVLAHETSVYALRFDEDGDLWTASADGTTKCLSRFQGFRPDATIQHGDYVRAVAIDEAGGYVVTGGRSEDIKVWDRGNGDLVHTFEGHYEEVTGLLMLGQRCLSVGIDGTIRVWSLDPEDMRDAKVKHNTKQGEPTVDHGATSTQPRPEQGASGLTEDEERELNELMQDDDE
ncbi:MAG: hypothetical protein Q9220_003018 [cf. Caloplaca sp. 1 TL-2023]